MLNAGGWLLVVVLFVIGGLTLTTLGLHLPYMDLPNAGEYTIHLILFVCEKLQVGTRNAEQNLTNYTRRSCVHTPLFLLVLHISLTTCIPGTYVGDIRKCAKLTGYATSSAEKIS